MTLSPTSLLVSQIGYDLRAPMRALWRGALPEGGAMFRLQEESGKTVLEKPLVFWGHCWGSDWWVADFSELTRAGTFTLTLEEDGFPAVTCPPFPVGEYHLWHSTVKTVAIEQFEQRAEQARFGNGWKDCGADMREVGSHTGALIGLLDLLNLGLEWLGREDGRRLARQIMHGCDYLVLCQQRAADLGWPPGSVVHEIPNHPVLIPQDQGQFVVALAKASRYIYELDRARGLDYLKRAAAAYEFLTRVCQPSTLPHFSAQLHGAPESYSPLPAGEGRGEGLPSLPAGEDRGEGLPPLPAGEGRGEGISPLPAGEGRGEGLPPLPAGEDRGEGLPPLPVREGRGESLSPLPVGEGRGEGLSPLPVGEGRGEGNRLHDR